MAVGGAEVGTGGQRGNYDTANALVGAAEESAAVNGVGCGIDEQAREVGRLQARLERVEGIDEQVYGKSSKCAGLQLRSEMGKWPDVEVSYEEDVGVSVAGHGGPEWLFQRARGGWDIDYFFGGDDEGRRII